MAAEADGEFSPTDILYAGEIGLVVDDVPSTVNLAQRELGMHVCRRSRSDYFAALGYEYALLILVKRNRLWTPDKKRKAGVHPASALIRSFKTGAMVSKDLGYHVTTGAN
ncbi:MAG: hypothetical protein CMO80_14655 [Verrucomicrobiales bacterium]|nr:hypothetical protein [Verrucomicrobiales bacterium]|tara:strand:+ start:633 stop:962 length:330 start_codon:yes stop_codon:yes gene_type:complete